MAKLLPALLSFVLIYIVMPESPGISYSRGDLLNLNPGRQRLPRDVYTTLLDLNICTVRPTRRGCRAGRDTQRSVSVLMNQRHHEVIVDTQTVHRVCTGPNPDNLREVPPHNKSKLSFCCLNVQSLRIKTTEFHDFVLENNLDVVAITETWLYPSGDEIAISELTPTGYTFHHIPRCVPGEKRRRGGGVGILYKSCLTVKIKSDVKSYSTFESLHAELSSNSTFLHLVIVYRPERDVRGQTFNYGLFLNEFESMIDDYILQPDVLFTGDFNTHVNNQTDNEANRFKSLLSSNGSFST